MKTIDKVYTLTGNASPDGVLFDLEDAINGTNEDKALARDNIFRHFSRSDLPKKNMICTIRVNCPFATPWGREDIEMIQKLPRDAIHAIVLPKVNHSDDITSVVENIISYSSFKSIPIWPMIETAKGIQNVDSIAANKYVETLVFGANDMSKELHCHLVPSRLPLMYSFSKCILAARAEGKYVIDGVFMDIKNSDGLRADTLQGLEFGFDGKTLIHPSQVEIVNEIFCPSERDIQHAREVVHVYKEAQKSGRGVVLLNGKLIEHLHVQQALSILDKVELINSKKS